MSFIKEQLGKEKAAAKRVWGVYMTIAFWSLMGFAILIGLSLLLTSSWYIGLIFILGASYVIYRKKKKPKVISE